MLVLDHGRVAEFDSPRVLLQRSANESMLSSMVEDTGPKSARFLRLIAEGAVDIFGNVLQPEIADPFDDANAVPSPPAVRSLDRARPQGRPWAHAWCMGRAGAPLGRGGPSIHRNSERSSSFQHPVCADDMSIRARCVRACRLSLTTYKQDCFRSCCSSFLMLYNAVSRCFGIVKGIGTVVVAGAAVGGHGGELRVGRGLEDALQVCQARLHIFVARDVATSVSGERTGDLRPALGPDLLHLVEVASVAAKKGRAVSVLVVVVVHRVRMQRLARRDGSKQLVHCVLPTAQVSNEVTK